MTAPFLTRAAIVMSMPKSLAVALAMSLALALAPAAAGAQAGAAVVPAAGGSDRGPGGWQDATAGSALEDYLRTLQVAGMAPLAMVGLRAWSPWELPRITPSDSTNHPWRARLAHASPPGLRLRVAPMRAAARTTYNSSFPFGLNDGAVWKGRGVTQELSAGVRATWGPLMVQLVPVAFWSQNASVALAPNGLRGDAAFGDPTRAIDRPQRFGNGSYARVDPGQSTIRVDAFGVTAGVSTANEVWGPGVTHPLLMSANAAGIPRAFAGTARPIDLWIGRVHGRIMVGQLQSSPYAPPQVGEVDYRRRAALGAVASLAPRFAPTLEVGVTRMYQTQWRGVGQAVNDASLLFEGILKGNVGYDTLRSPQNQMASAFFRWAFPPAVEIYGELYREDHSLDFRDFLVEPEHDLGYLVGLRRVWRGAQGARLTALRLEVVNGRPTALRAVRPQTYLYTHGTLRSGHTQLGQVLGSEALMGGGGGILALDRFTERGALSLAYQRIARGWKAGGASGALFAERGQDVIHTLGGELTRFRGPLAWRAGAQFLYEVNRDFDRDVTGVQLTAGASWRP